MQVSVQDATEHHSRFMGLWHAEIVLRRALLHLDQSFGTLAYPHYLTNVEVRTLLSRCLLRVELERCEWLAKQAEGK